MLTNDLYATVGQATADWAPPAGLLDSRKE
jgi:hypothetical protein